MKPACRIALAAGAVAAVALGGCGRHAVPAPKAKPAAAPQVMPLPDWAPRNPSPEFSRAAKVLKPMPEEVSDKAAGGDLGAKALFRSFRRTWPAIYELFGTLSDAQLKRFTKTKQVYIPVRDLTARQRKALDHLLDAFATAMAPVNRIYDVRVSLYKIGAREDFSNVTVGFDVPKGEGIPVHLRFLVRQAGGKRDDIGFSFAYM